MQKHLYNHSADILGDPKIFSQVWQQAAFLSRAPSHAAAPSPAPRSASAAAASRLFSERRHKLTFKQCVNRLIALIHTFFMPFFNIASPIFQ